MPSKSNAHPDKIKVMFVCLGNICRSPLAHGLFRNFVAEAGLAEHFEIESSGTGAWHIGQRPHAQMRQTAQRHGLSLDGLHAQQFTAEDLDAFDHIFVMDKSNLHDVLLLDDDDRHGHKVRLFRELDPDPGDFQVPDPYYEGRFDHVYSIVERTARALLDRLVEEHDLAGEEGSA